MFRLNIRSIGTPVKSALMLSLVGLIALGVIVGPRLVSAQNDTSFAVGDALVVNTDALNLRSDASVSSDVPAVLDTGEAVTIASDAVPADGYDWYLVDSAEGSGYVAGEFLGSAVTVSTSLGYGIGDSLVVNTDRLNLRSSFSSDSDALAVLVTGDSTTIVDGPVGAEGYTWYEVDTASGTGWVAGDYLAYTQTVSSSLGFSIGSSVIVDTDVLNLRSDATTDADVLATLETGATGTIL